MYLLVLCRYRNKYSYTQKLETWVSPSRHIVWETYVFLQLLSNVLSASLAAGPSEYGAVKGGAIMIFITN